MGEYEPRDSRNVTLRQDRAPGEPPRTGPREHETRQPQQQQTELEDDGRGEEVERTVPAEEQEALQRPESMRGGADAPDPEAADPARRRDGD